MKTYTYALLFCMLLSYTVNGQTDWSPLVSKDGVVVFFRKIDCGNSESYFVLKFVNNNTCDVSLVWDIHVWVDGSCQTCNDMSGKNHCILSLSSGKTKVGGCEDSGDKRFCVHNRPQEYQSKTKSVDLSNLQLANFRVLKLGG